MGNDNLINEEYIDLLIKYSDLQKVKNRNVLQDKELLYMKNELLHIELSISSAEILHNTKIAFPKATSD